MAKKKEQEDAKNPQEVVEAQEPEAAPVIAEQPVIAEGIATIKDVSGKSSDNIIKISVDNSLAIPLFENKACWGSVEIRIKSCQTAIPVAEIEDDEGGMFDDIEPEEDPEAEEAKEPDEKELEGDEKQEEK